MLNDFSIKWEVIVNGDQKREVVTIAFKKDGKYTYITDTNAPGAVEHLESHTPAEALKDHMCLLTIATMHE